MGRPDLSDLEHFWTAPIAERAAAFAHLREHEPVPFFPEPTFGMLPPGPGYWALTRFVDVVVASAARLPLKIVCDMMGVPESQYDCVYAKTNAILGVSDPEYVEETADVLTAVLQAGHALAELMRELGRTREQRPTDDVTSALVNAEIDGERLTPDELASFFILLVVAGNETTRNAISWGLHLLTEHPEQRRIWLADLDGVTPTAVEEIVRWASPVIFMRRTLAVDTVLGGQAMQD